MHMSVAGIIFSGEEEVNDVIVINNVIRKGDCNYLISNIDKLNLEARGPLKDRLMRYYETPINNLTQEYALAVKELVVRYQSPAHDLFTTDYGVFVSRKGYEMQPHIDTVNDYGLFDYLEYAAVLYLNDDYEGGEIYFPNLEYSYAPKRGDLVIFPANDEKYLHGVNKVLSGNRYTLAYWYSKEGNWVTYFN